MSSSTTTSMSSTVPNGNGDNFEPVDTKENRLLIWYGTSDAANDGIVSIIIKVFNGKRSDESSKKIRPILGMCICFCVE